MSSGSSISKKNKNSLESGPSDEDLELVFRELSSGSRNACISRERILEWAEEIDLDLEEEDVEVMLQEADRAGDNDGRVSMEDFKAIMRQTMKFFARKRGAKK